MARRFAKRHLDFTDLISEAAIAVYMVVIINGYVALSQLSTQFYYILAVDIGACVAWGFLDGFTYAIGGSIDRGQETTLIRDIQSEKSSDKAVDKIIEDLDDTFLSRFTPKAKRTIALEVLKNSTEASIPKQHFMTREDLGGLASIIGIYLTAGVALSIPYVIIPNKIDAWILSNVLGIAWLFYYGFTVGKIVGTKRVLIGLFTATAGIIFLVLSYLTYAY